MSPQLLMLLFVLMVVLPGGYYIFTFILPPRNKVKELISNSDLEPLSPTMHTEVEPVSDLKQIQRVGSRTQRTNDREAMPALEEKLFRAGFMRQEEHNVFKMIQFISPIIGACLMYFTIDSFSTFDFIIRIGLGVFVGVFLPLACLDRIIARRNEEIMYFLPLVIEQFVIGVSSGLDIGPCIHRVVAVADERDTHNPVTELLRNVLLLTRSGTTLDDALAEVGTLAGHTELKHSFMTMGQVSRHGGEITKQLQELANAVSSQRETKIEGRVKRLELNATGPVVLVFISFMGILFIGIGLQMMKALNI